MSVNIENATVRNTHYRKVISTNKFQQVVVMSLNKGENIPLETHDGSQFFRIEAGTGIAKVGNKSYRLRDGIALVVGPGQKHIITATSATPLKLYTIYSPPQHKRRAVLIRQPRDSK